jgi:rRNA maturation RNase YbeY
MISFDSDYDEFDLENKSIFQKWLKDVITQEGKTPGDIHYIFLTDSGLLEINQQFLNHHDYTDIITFPLSESEQIIRGEIYISLDRVKENALLNNVNFYQEFARVLVHGVLHLLDYNDHTKEEKHQMRSKENYYLNLLPQ